MNARFLAGCFLLCATAAASFATSPAAAAAVTPRGDIFRVDETPDCLERQPDAASFAHGGFVVAWTGSARPGEGGESRAFARVFDAAGASFGPEIPVETAPSVFASNVVEVAVAATSVSFGDRFLLAWYDDSRRVVATRLYSAAGTALGDENILLDDAVNGVQLDATALPDGTFAVVLSHVNEIRLQFLEVDGEPSSPLIEVYSVNFFFPPAGLSPFPSDPAIAAQPDGDLVIAWHERTSEPDPSSGLNGLLIPAGTASQSPQWRFLQWGQQGDPLAGWKTGLELGTDAAGNTLAVWRVADRIGADPFTFRAQRFDPLGTGIGNAFEIGSVTARTWERLGIPSLLVNPDGSFLLAWHGILGDRAPLPTLSSVYVQSFGATGVAQGDFVEAAAPGSASREEPALARAADGGAVVAWQEGRTGLPSSCFSSGISARRLSAGCQSGPNRLCLGDGRFQLETTWVAPGTGAGSGPGQAVQVTRDTGYFWFFDHENVELMVKVLDGRSINGKFWVFYGSLSNVAWRLRVTDLVTGEVRNYDNPRNTLASRGDTDALPGSFAAATGGATAFEGRPTDIDTLLPPPPPPAPATEASHAPGEELAGPCTAQLPITPPPTRPGLCLNESRFEVEVTWHDPFGPGQGGQGVGQGVGLTDDSGYFWFFNPANVELVVKVLDARAINGKYWVFYGALTNVEYDIRVRNVDTGEERTYHNPPFQFRSHADTSAFPLP